MREYGEKFGLKALVETGTYYGEMVAATKHYFDRIYSIELDAVLAEWALRETRQIVETQSERCHSFLLVLQWVHVPTHRVGRYILANF